MKNFIILMLLASFSMIELLFAESVQSTGCDLTNCQAEEFEWPLQRDNEEQLEELVSKLRCRIACNEEISGECLRDESVHMQSGGSHGNHYFQKEVWAVAVEVNNGSQEPSNHSAMAQEVDQCTKGCLIRFRNATLSAEDCQDLCESATVIPCRTGCTIYENYMREESGSCTSEGSEEFSFVSAGPICEMYSCNNSSLRPTEVNCSDLGNSIESCSFNITEDPVTFGLAKCCHICGVPESPVSPPLVQLGSEGKRQYITTAPNNYNTSNGVVLFRIQEMLTLNTSTSYIYISESDALVEGLPLPPCSNISVSFAIINKFGMSEFSPATDTCTVLPPGRPQNLEIQLEGEDFRPTYLGHAVLTISWEQPEDYTRVAYYELIVDIESVNNTRALCTQQESLRIEINNNVSSYSLRANNNKTSSPPHFDCHYRFTMRSHPGSENTSVEFQVKYRGPRPRSDLICRTRFDPTTNKYDFIAEWTVPSLLALEATSRFKSEVLDILQSGSLANIRTVWVDKMDGILQYRAVHQDLRLLVGAQDGYYLLSVKHELQPIRGGFRPLFWRTPLVPLIGSCELDAPPVRPSPITNITVRDISLLEETEIVKLTIKWEPPLFPNGEIRTYQLRLGREEIPPNSVDFQGQLSYRRDIQPTGQNEVTIEEFLPFFFEPDSNETLHVQMRSQNEYSLAGFSEWSESLQINISEYLVPANLSTPSLLPDDPLPLFAYILFGITGLIIFAAIAVPIYVGCYRSFICRAKMGPMQQLPDIIANNLLLPLPTPDKWEISLDELEVYESQPLGKGQFGEVFKGLLRGQPARKRSSTRGRSKSPKYSMTHTVAVKKLKKTAFGPEKAAFLKEINTMKRVSDADNESSRFVVNMLGCVTGREPLLLILEYVRHGDLLSYLRSMRKQAEAAYFNPLTEAATPYLEPNGVYSHLAPFGAEEYSDLGVLEERNLLEFARQIAAGMEFLASMDIIHRDLACRNILVGENKILKISDFGMSRLVPAEEVYVNTTHGLLPLRWMALESIFYRKFTTLSDVWSYGIALWEICTLGGFPFPTLSNKELPSFLKHGYRMDKPPNCSQDVYEVMLSCWSEDPDQRPKFSKLHDIFDQFLSRHTQDKYPYMELQTSPPYIFDKLDPLSNATNPDTTPINLDVEEQQLGVRLCPADNRLAGTHLPVPENRLSIRSALSSQWGSDQDVRLLDTEIDRISQLSIPVGRDGKEPETRYVESPVPPRNRTSMLVVPDLSIKDDLIAHLERRLSNLGSRNHLRVQSDCLDLACSIDDTSPFELHPPQRGALSLSVPEVRYENAEVCTCCREYHSNEGENGETEEERIFRETDV